jgi:hypothetical protein
MFTVGKIVFTGFFILVFIAAMFWSYQKDKKVNLLYFKGASKILLGIILVLTLLVVFVKNRHRL